MAAAASTTYDDRERAFLQARFALFAKWAFVLSLSTDFINVALVGWEELGAGLFLDRAITLELLVMWALSVRYERSVRFLRVLDAVSAFAISATVTVMGRFMASALVPQLLSDHGSTSPPTPTELGLIDTHSAMLIILGGAVMFTFRAAVIPTSPRFTLFATGVLGLPFVLVPTFIAPGGLSLRAQPAWRELLGYVIWWAIVTAACTAISAVIYGLRREVRDARRLGQYTLLEKLGEGGMGIVYRAQHARLRRPTAIKLLPEGRLTDDAIARFESEVQLTAQLTHQNTVTVFDYGRTDDGVFYYAMEYLEGATLGELVEVDGDQPAERVVHLVTQTASALQEAHAVGLIHRDIKPANIMLTKQGVEHDVVKLLDFGLARPIDRSDDAKHTLDNRLVGTPMYMAPEVIRDADSGGEAADLYSLGGVAYFLLTGTHVFTADSIVEICAHHLHTPPEPPSERTDRHVPAALEALVLQCLAKAPEERPSSAAEVVQRLREVHVDPPWSEERAASWWRSRRERLEQRRSQPEVVRDVVLTVPG